MDSRFRCPLSLPDQPHPLFFVPVADINNPSLCFHCGKQESQESGKDYGKLQLCCTGCDVIFHSGCYTFPKNITHSFHFQHPLTLTLNSKEKHVFVDRIPPQCTWCGEHITDEQFYQCLICNFCLDYSCFLKNPPLTIAKPKSHHHSLIFFPRPFLLPCDACGSVNASEPSYACFQCNYMVHQTCIDLPRVIKITYHHHRLFHTPYFQPPISLCRICYKTIDIKYGLYSCKKEDCNFVAHSKCATHKNIWDGKELEWEPEEVNDDVQDYASFTKVSDDMIKYFGHEHLLRLKKYDIVEDIEKQCEACNLSIDFQNFYHCSECEFYLHEVCANLPRKINHVLHKHPLFLDPSPPHQDYTTLFCSSCSRLSHGFKYKCKDKDCNQYKVDIRCILVPEYSNQEIHDHPLFISVIYTTKDEVWCKGCKSTCSSSRIQCTICEFAICYGCATIPKEIQYKYDKHPLTLCYGEDTNETYWCEVCEKKLDSRQWFYTCNKCCITIHIECLFGSSSYLKSGYTISRRFHKVQVLCNNGSTRPICRKCGDRCQGHIYFKLNEKIACSLDCSNFFLFA